MSLLSYGFESPKRPKDWFEAFYLLERLIKQKDDGSRLAVFIGELPWLDSKGSFSVEAFEGFWNSFGCAQNNLMMIVCGSATSWMERNFINSHGGLYDRVTYEIKLSQFTLYECEEFLKEKSVDFTRYDIACAYMALGGIPYYLNCISKEYSLA